MVTIMSANQQMRPTDFFDRHPVFRFDEFAAAHAAGGRSRQTTASVLKQHVATGRLLHLRRGLYAAVPRGSDPRSHPVDPYLLATQLAADAVVAYHATLQFHGKAYSQWNRFHYLTRGRQRRFTFGDQEFVPVQAPAALRDLPGLGGGVVERPHAGGVVRVTTLERSLVDVLDAPERNGGWEEVWRSLEMVEFFDLDAVLAYARVLGSALTAARVGFFLEQHRDALMVEAHHLDAFRALAPAQPRYLDSRREPGRLVKDWNLVVPERVLTRSWAEVSCSAKRRPPGSGARRWRK
jgi:predicted transcriptional regulator of viral defense system